jgi:polysaccharide export outer membrane protein
MRSGKGGLWQLWPAVPAGCRLGLVVCLLAGCAQSRPHLDQAVKADRGGAARNAGVPEQYLVRCPDVLEITVADRPDLSTTVTIGPDGRLDLDLLGRPRVEGQTPAEVAAFVAIATAVPPDSVQVHIVEYNSQQIYLFGEVIGLPRAVPYHGPETVLDLLQRVGGVTAGAASGDVHVIRAHVADGRNPEDFHIDLKAITLHKDEGTNVRLQPFDQVYVGPTRGAVIDRCMPPWLRPMYQSLVGMRRQP